MDDWTTRFEGIHELQHLGGGVAPWNVQQYSFRRYCCGIVGTEMSTNNEFCLVFYHFHFLKSYASGKWRYFKISHFPIPSSAIQLIYEPYLKELKKCSIEIMGITKDVDGLATQISDEYSNFCGWLKKIRRHLWIEKDNRYHYWISRK